MKDKRKFKRKMEKLNGNIKRAKKENYSLPGQPTPLTITFTELKQRALETPMLKEFTQDDVNVNRHSKVTDYSSSYILAVVVLVTLQDREFFWQIQSAFISKVSGKYIELNLLTPNQIKELKLAKDQVLAFSKPSVEVETKNSCFWEIPFRDSDYEKLDASLLALTYKNDRDLPE